VKPPAKRVVIRRMASPGAAALKARADAENAPPRNHIKAGALEVWGSITAWLARMRDDGAAPRPVRPSEVGVDRVLVGASWRWPPSAWSWCSRRARCSPPRSTATRRTS
jgi:hypothetical protein